MYSYVPPKPWLMSTVKSVNLVPINYLIISISTILAAVLVHNMAC